MLKLSFRHDDTSILTQIQQTILQQNHIRFPSSIYLNGSKLSLVHPSSLLSSSRLVSTANFGGSKRLAGIGPFSGA